MGLNRYPRRIVPALIIAGLVCVQPADPSVLAHASKERPATAGVAAPLTSGTSPGPSKIRGTKPDKSESRLQPAKVIKPGKKTTRRPLQAQQRPKKLPPKTTAGPPPDMSYLGKFEAPQRYDPSRRSRKEGAPNPQAGAVQHDHFQELDRNHDGVIDPFEQASGRLDIDRDLANRQWE